MKTRYKFISGAALTLGALFGAAACAPVKILNGLTPSSAYTLEKDISE